MLLKETFISIPASNPSEIMSWKISQSKQGIFINVTTTPLFWWNCIVKSDILILCCYEISFARPSFSVVWCFLRLQDTSREAWSCQNATKSVLSKSVNCYLLEYVSAIETCQIVFTKKKVFSSITHLLPRLNFTEKLENLSLYPWFQVYIRIWANFFMSIFQLIYFIYSFI